MIRQKTVVLRHDSAHGTHFDWMLEAALCVPTSGIDEHRRLWTARTMLHPLQWAATGFWPLEVIEAHRPAYLTYEGPIGGNRGRVVRVAFGHFTWIKSSLSDLMIRLEMQKLDGTVRLRRVCGRRWIAACV